MNNRLLLTAALAVALSASQTMAADIVPVILDNPGDLVDPAEGYYDPTPAVPVGGNPGTSIGEQRRIVAQFAADLWGGVLKSEVPVFVGAQFNPLPTNVLGRAGSTYVFANFPNAPVANTWYSSALADAIAGVDQVDDIDIFSEFSSNFAFYYGLDGQTPAGQVNFLDVVMHEFGHGLGFQNFETEATGAFYLGVQDIYSTFTYDNTTGKRWTQMTPSERQASALNYGNVIFDGASATAGAALVLGPRTGFRVTAPAGIAGDYAYGTASFGAAATPANFAGNVVLALDAVIPVTSATATDGCSPFNNAAAVAGNIALVDRGSCSFAVKAKNAQNAGASGLIVANNAAVNPPPGMIGADPTVVIPTIMVTQATGTSFKANLPGVQVAFIVDPSKLQGADNAGRPRLFMPNPVQGGSSGSHYDINLSPNALMEPAINSTLLGALNLDITPNLLRDTGWPINDGNAKINGCDTTIDVVDDAGIIIGANVEATSKLCVASSADKGAYQGCMEAYKDKLVASGLVTGKQGGKIMACAAKILK